GEDWIIEQMHEGLWPPRDPEAVADRIEHEDQEYQYVGRDQHHAPELRPRPWSPGRGGWGLRGCGDRDGGHAWRGLSQTDDACRPPSPAGEGQKNVLCCRRQSGVGWQGRPR